MISSGSPASDEPSGSTRSPAVTCAPMASPAIETSISVGRCVASASRLTDVFSCWQQTAGDERADDRERNVDGDLLAATDRQQVDVLVVALDRVALDRLRDGELLAALEFEGQQHVGAAVLDRVGELARGQRHVARVGAVAVDDGRDLAGATGAAGTALAELGTRFGVQTDLGHSGTP